MIWDFSKYKNNVALISEEKIIDYSQLTVMSEQISCNLPQRSLVFLLCTNTIESVAGYIGFMNHEIVPVMIDSSLNTELLFKLVERYRPKFFWLPEKIREFFPDCEEVYSLGRYILLESRERNPYPLYGELALLMTTSGSTGSPKLVRLSYKNVVANTKSIIEYLQIGETERSVTNLPMHYVYGLSIINTHLYVGASIVMTEKSMFQKDFWNMMVKRGVTNFGGVPYTFEMLNRLKFFKMNLPDLKTITQAGGKLKPELHEKFADYANQNGKKFIVMYGAAEATARMGYLPAKDSLRKFGSMGIPIPGGKFVLIDDDGRVVDKPDVIGELVYYGDNVMLGYAEYGNDLAKSDEEKGKLKTGDLAKFDEEGYYFIVGRKKRFLKIYGKRINLQEVEFILQKHYDTLGIAVSGMDDLMYIFVDDERILEDIKEYVSVKFNIHHLAIQIHCVENIPKNSSGKTLYGELESKI